MGLNGCTCCCCCQILGFFYPGSPLWQVQRKLRQAGQHSKGTACAKVHPAPQIPITRHTIPM